MSCDRRSSGNSGFTLVELLVAMTLLGLLLSVAPAVLPNALPRFQLAAAARSLASDLRVERSVARMEGRNAGLDLDVRNRQYTVTADLMLRTVPRDIGIEVLTVAARDRYQTGVTIRFYPDGSSSGGRIALTREGQSAIVDVNWLTGRITIE